MRSHWLCVHTCLIPTLYKLFPCCSLHFVEHLLQLSLLVLPRSISPTSLCNSKHLLQQSLTILSRVISSTSVYVANRLLQQSLPTLLESITLTSVYIVSKRLLQQSLPTLLRSISVTPLYNSGYSSNIYAYHNPSTRNLPEQYVSYHTLCLRLLPCSWSPPCTQPVVSTDLRYLLQ